jgi:hypothetical protein
LGTIEGLDLALLVEAEHDGVGGRIDIETNHFLELLGDLGSLESLNERTQWVAARAPSRCVAPKRD